MVSPPTPSISSDDALATDGRVSVPLAYAVYVRTGALAHAREIAGRVAPAHKVAIIADDRVAALHAPALLAQYANDEARLFAIPPGENEKTRARWGELTDALLLWGAGRDTTVIALGGGVVGDLAGFVAATYMRGIPVVQIPTTLLAMVDASVGGKTAIDTPFGKNLVGAFHDPSAVIMDPALLATLGANDLRSGLAEMLKHGVIADAAYFQAMRDALPHVAQLGAHAPQLAGLIAGSVRIKAAVVADDHKENGRRHTLNFGHTIAHAIERVLNYQILHGDAVAIGMLVESRLAEEIGVAIPGTASTIEAAVRLAGLPHTLPLAIAADDIVNATRGDKKNRAGSVRYSLPKAIGLMDEAGGHWAVSVDDAIVLALLKSMLPPAAKA